jgi:ribosomal protein L32
MLSEIVAGIGALKTASEIAKTLIDIDDKVALNELAIKLQTQILTAQEAAISAQGRIQELEAVVRASDEWKEQKDRYKLVDYGAGTFAWELRPECSNGEPAHRVCPKCFEKRKRSILQFKNRTYAHQDFFVCNSCETEFFFGAYNPGEPVRARTNFNVFDV